MTIKVDIVTEYKNKGAQQAEKSLLSLDGTAKKLAKTITKTFAVYQIIKFGKAAATAFAQDEASAASLANTLRNLNAELSIPAAESAIAQLQQMTAVVDDELRPAFAQLFRILGSVSEASSTLGLATEISRGTGESLATVVDAITKAYAGNTRGLLALNTGLTKAEINSGDMQMIMEKLNSMFAGSNAAYLDTYAGKMSALSVIASDAMEKIGAGIFDALAILTGSTDIEVITKKVSDYTTSLVGFIKGIATVIKDIYDNTLKPIIGFFQKAYDFLQKIGVIKKDMGQASWGNLYGDPASIAAAANDKKLAAQRLAQEKKLQAEQKKTAAARLKAEKDAQTIKKAGTLFDIDKIQILAALQGKLTEQEKTRLELQLALLTDNAAEADRLSRELFEAQMLTTGLAAAIRNLPEALNPFAKWAEYAASAKAALFMRTDAEVQAVNEVVTRNVIGKMDRYEMGYANALPSNGGNNPPVVNVKVEVGGQQLTDVVTTTQLNNSASGVSSKINRLSLID